MTKLFVPTVDATLVSAATHSFASADRQRDWARRQNDGEGLFETWQFVPEPKPGRSRVYPLITVYEIALAVWHRRQGLPLIYAAYAFSRRFNAAAPKVTKDPRSTPHKYWKAVFAADYPDLQPAAPVPYLWAFAIGPERYEGGPTFRGFAYGTDIAALAAQLARPEPDHQDSGLLVVPITAIVREVHAMLDALGWSADD